MLERMQRNVSLLGRSESTFKNYSRHIASMALHFQCLPTELDPECLSPLFFGVISLGGLVGG